MRTRRDPLGHPQAPLVLGVAGFVVVGLAWQAMADLHWINPILFGSPSSISGALVQWWASGQMPHDLAVSLTELAVGFFAGSAVGILVGLAMGQNWLVECSMDPFVWLLYATPLVAFWPLFIIWFGIGSSPIIALTFLLTVITVIVNTIAGVRGVPPVLIRCARSFNARPLDIVLKFTLPSALPMIVAGLRLAVGRAVIGVVVGEMFSGQAGIGFHITYESSKLKFDGVFAAVLLVALIGVGCTQIVRLLETRILVWKQ